MDNVCHTLVGAAMAEAGLKKYSAHATAALMVAANIPDLDVLVFATDTPAIEFRRGWTHGVVGQALLPIAVTLAFMLWVRLKPRPMAVPFRPLRLLGLAYAALYSHLFLDFLNNYGVRLLAPIEWRWFYGDAVFVIDPWMWLILGVGVWTARRRRMPLAAAIALGAATGYVLAMLGSAAVSREAVT